MGEWTVPLVIRAPHPFAARVVAPTVQLFDVASGRELATLEAPDVQDQIAVLSFSPDGARLVAGSRSRRLRPDCGAV